MNIAMRCAAILCTAAALALPTAHSLAQPWEERTLQYGASLEESLVVFLDQLVSFTEISLCLDEFDSIEEALRDPFAACEIFVTRQGALDVPDTIARLTRLESFGIDGPSPVTVSPLLWTMPSLNEVQIAHAGLLAIPDTDNFLPNVVNLDLSGNGLTSLPEGMKNATALKHLFVRENLFSSEEQQRIRSMLPDVEVIFD